MPRRGNGSSEEHSSSEEVDGKDSSSSEESSEESYEESYEESSEESEEDLSIDISDESAVEETTTEIFFVDIDPWNFDGIHQNLYLVLFI